MHVSEPSCCRGLHCAYICVYFPSNRLPHCSVREGRKMRPAALLVFMRGLCVCVCDLLGQPCTRMCLWFVNVLCVQVPTANTRSGSRQVGLEGMELQQPHPCQATILNISLAVFSLKSRVKCVVASWFKLVLLTYLGWFQQVTIHHWKCPL